MVKLLEWAVIVVLPAAGAIVLTAGLMLHLAGRLAPALRALAPSRRQTAARLQRRRGSEA